MASVIIVDDSAAGGRVAAQLIGDTLRSSRRPVLGVATGSTPLPIWSALAASEQDLSSVTAFALDEYLDLEPGHPQSYRAVVDREITGPLRLDRGHVHVPQAHGDLDQVPRDYEAAIRAAGGVDIQVLGIGRNGHIGFNEPGASLSGRTHVAALSEQTRIDNARFFGSLEKVPRRCITQGVGTILEARQLLLVAFGQDKAAAIAAALEGPVTASVPASAIQLHPNVVAIIDEAAASELAFAAHYRLSARRGEAA